MRLVERTNKLNKQTEQTTKRKNKMITKKHRKNAPKSTSEQRTAKYYEKHKAEGIRSCLNARSTYLVSL